MTDGPVVGDPTAPASHGHLEALQVRFSDWVGIDISDRAIDLVVEHIEERQGLFRDIVHRSDIPQRTDLWIPWEE